ncbi:glycosyltransferase [Microcoleus sp. FACHB-1515]|uniref:glycosyltransferase family 2 protein n=1 Tax=Cyanophyceae TaxID=3028117 RepID=UPI001683A6F9|nr:glycosyltransferase [Microcoleus sp. FACHB-1515]MBD2092213.1 glycosyltransferase [Microcoleus sp. FACHB-1515]
MFSRIKPLDIELSQPIATISNLDGYDTLQGLVKFRGTPIGSIQLPIANGCCPAAMLAKAILHQCSRSIAQQSVFDRLSDPKTNWNDSMSIMNWLQSKAAPRSMPLSVTVALCLEAENPAIAECLTSLEAIAPVADEILIVESAPTSETLAQLLASRYPHFRYLQASSLNAARNLATSTAQSDIVAFTAAHSRVDANWLHAIATSFDRNPDAIALTGLIVADQLKTETQIIFEQNYSFNRGLDRRWHHLGQTPHWTDLGTMQLGTGLNMAFRRTALAHLGGFDELLDAYGGELDLFCRVLLSGQTLIYEPSAIARYRPSLIPAALHEQAKRNGFGFAAYLKAIWHKYPQYRRQIVILGGWKLARSLLALRHNPLMATELQSGWQGLVSGRSRVGLPAKLPAPTRLIAVREVNLSEPLPTWTDLSEYEAVRVFVIAAGWPIGSVDIQHRGQTVSAARLQHAIAQNLTLPLLAIPHQHDQQAAWAAIETQLQQALVVEPASKSTDTPHTLTPDLPVSIVITTCDRPNDLHNCLTHLLAQQTQRPIEIVVADNRPHSNLTPPVIAEFPTVKLVQEARPGGSYGRNAAIAATTSEIIVTIDDDITVPPDWLEKLIAPMNRLEVAIVTGNVLPRELETPAQILVERLRNGLSQGFVPFEADGRWLAAYAHTTPPTWELGVSANAAFRASIFAHPQIGLMEEVLGPGTPTAGAEESYLMYKTLNAGYTIVYQPQAYVWHRHRREMSALHRQIHGYMKSATAYNLTLWLKDGDRRALRHQFWELPNYYARRIYHRLRGWDKTPWLLLWQEVSGYFAGYWCYWQSWQRVQRQGRSDRYIPVSERAIASSHPQSEVVKAHGS